MRGALASLAACTVFVSAACDKAAHDAAAADSGHVAPPRVPAPGASSANVDDPASAETAASTRAARWNAALEAATRIPCRAIAVDGSVRLVSAAPGDAGVPDAGTTTTLATQAQLPPDAWLIIGPDSRVVAKDPRTARETTFLGPAQAHACVAQHEESWLAWGAFESVMGAGEGPGAEEWVVTPHAIVRYIAARVRVEVGVASTSLPSLPPQRAIAVTTTVALTGGSAFLWYGPDVHETAPPAPHGPAASADAGSPGDAGPATTLVDDDGWRRMSEGTLTLALDAARRTPQGALASAGAAVDACASLGKKSRDLAGALLEGTSLDGKAGEVAKEQVMTRRLARAACAVAALRVARVGHVGDAPASTSSAPMPPGGYTTLAARLDEANAVWSPASVPPVIPPALQPGVP